MYQKIQNTTPFKSQLSQKDELNWPNFCERHYKSPTALSDMQQLTCGISSLLHSVNLILFTLLFCLVVVFDVNWT